MKNLLNKEFRLAASPLTWIFLAGALMTLLPGYPILMGSFFVCFGIFHSFQNVRESNDILYSVLLPVRKIDIVRAKYVFTIVIQLLGFMLMSVLTVIRMTALSDLKVYLTNALMNATPLYLAFVLMIYTAFNLLFLKGFFKSAYKIGFPFLSFGVASFMIITIAESLHYLPGLSFLNVPAGERTGLQLLLLASAVLIYLLLTLLSLHCSISRFEKIDL